MADGERFEPPGDPKHDEIADYLALAASAAMKKLAVVLTTYLWVAFGNIQIRPSGRLASRCDRQTCRRNAGNVV